LFKIIIIINIKSKNIRSLWDVARIEEINKGKILVVKPEGKRQFENLSL
jgi:hypothetical protein